MSPKPPILDRLRGVQPQGTNWLAFCPAHNDQHKRSLSVKLGTDGRTLLFCHAQRCEPEAIARAVDMSLAELGPTTNGTRPPPSRRREVASYDYRDERGELLYQVVRFEPKDFRCRRPAGEGWAGNLDGVRVVPYRLHELAEASRVYIPEGEKDCDALAALGLAATTNHGGAGKWRPEHTAALAAASVPEVVVLPDNDQAGADHARSVAEACVAAGLRVKVLRLPELSPKGDVSDWLASGHDVDELVFLATTALEYSAGGQDASATAGRPVIVAGSRASTAPGGTFGVGLGAFLLVEDPPLEPYIEGILSADGGGWISGEEKLGKTFWCLAEALSLALGIKLAGKFPVAQRRRVLFIEEEDSPRRTRARLRALLRGHGYADPMDPALLAELDAFFRIEVWSGFTFDNTEMVTRLDAALATFQPAVVYVDVLRKVTLRDLNKAAEAGVLLAQLDDLRRRHRVIFRIIAHYRKLQGNYRAGRGSQEISGSHVLGAWGENSIFFEPIGRKQGGGVKVEVQTKDAASPPAFVLRIASEGPVHAATRVTLTAEEISAAAVTEQLEDQILAALGSLPKTPPAAGKPGVTLRAICDAVKRSDRPVRSALKALQDKGLAEVVGQLPRKALLYDLVDRGGRSS